MESVSHRIGFGCDRDQDIDNFDLPGQRIRQRRDATGALIQGPESGAATAALCQQSFWSKSGKSQGFGDRVPIQIPFWVSHYGGNILRNADFPKENLFHD